MKNKPYVYRVDHPITGEFYIGYRCGNSRPPELDLGVDYFTSSALVKSRFFEFNSSIVAVFFSAEDAYAFEQELINENWKDPLCLNKSCYYGKSQFKQTSKLTDGHRSKISDAMKGKTFSAEHRQKLSEAKRGTTLSSETKQKMSDTRTGHITTEHTKKKISDAMKGKTFSAEHRQKLSEAAKNRKRRHEVICEKSPRLDTVVSESNLSDT